MTVTIQWHLALAVLLLAAVLSRPSWAEPGSNDACPADLPQGDDVRESYDEHGRLTRQLRFVKAELVGEAIVAYDASGHPTERIETAAGHTKIARTIWRGDHVVEAECSIDGATTARVVYEYDGEELIAKKETREGLPARTTSFWYDPAGRELLREIRGPTGELVSGTEAAHAPPHTPIQVAATGGATYQSDTDLLDANAGLGIHRKPAIERFGSDPLEVALDGAFKFNRARGITNADQVTARFGVDYNYVLPRITLFTFIASDRNLPANLKLNLEEAFLGVKVDIIPRARWQFDASLAPVWNFRAIRAPVAPGSTTTADQSTSTLRASLRVRAGYKTVSYNVHDTVEFLPLLFGDTPVVESGIWARSIFRNTVSLDVTLSPIFTFHQELKYTRDLSMRAQAACPDASNPLCRGYAVATLTALSLRFELSP